MLCARCAGCVLRGKRSRAVGGLCALCAGYRYAVAITHACVLHLARRRYHFGRADSTRSALILVCAFALEFIENDLADTHVVRCYLYILILLDVLQCFFEREDYWWWQYRLVVC